MGIIKELKKYSSALSIFDIQDSRPGFYHLTFDDGRIVSCVWDQRRNPIDLQVIAQVYGDGFQASESLEVTDIRVDIPNPELRDAGKPNPESGDIEETFPAEEIFSAQEISEILRSATSGELKEYIVSSLNKSIHAARII